MRFGIAAVGLALMAMGGAACNLIDFDRRDLQQQDPPSPTDMAREEPPRMCSPVVAEATPEYEAMCRHYCNELEATLTYLGANPEPAGSTAQGCWELRCVPRCVTRDLCESQCHSLGVAYQGLCSGVEAVPETMCPVTLDERVAACLEGCEAFVPPPEPTAPAKS